MNLLTLTGHSHLVYSQLFALKEHVNSKPKDTDES